MRFFSIVAILSCLERTLVLSQLPAIGIWSQWTTYSICSATCGGGTQIRTRICLGSGTCPGAGSQTLRCNIQPCRGAWSAWTAYSSCTLPCGGGTQTKTRICHGSRTCPGAGSQTLRCNIQACPGAWGAWTAYTACTLPCGGGTQTRTRTCQGAQNCPGSGTNILRCNTQACVKFQWSPWSQGDQCSATCGAGVILRRRRCVTTDGVVSTTLTACADPQNLGAVRTIPCNNGPCYSFRQWTDWTVCSPVCGRGQRTRNRVCFADNVPTSPLNCANIDGRQAEQVLECQGPPCYFYGEWADWTQCPVSCSEGTISRSRICRSRLPGPVPPGSCNTIDVIGAIQTQSCRHCYVLTDWTDWTTCSATCGAGQKRRSRLCINIGTGEPGTAIQCGVDLFVSEACALGPCYNWSPWSQGDQCSATCGAGVISRRRRCVTADGVDAASFVSCDDPPNLGSVLTIPCNVGPCYSFERWTDWTVCSPVCGRGQRTRSRVCFADKVPTSPLNCSDIDGGQAEQVLECQGPPCHYYDAWEDWTPCPVSCGEGTISRSRACRSRLPGPVSPGACNGIDDIGAIQKQTCNPVPCYSFGWWTDWTVCSPICGGGQRTRSRVCFADNVSTSPLNCTAIDGGQAEQVLECQGPPCYFYNAWEDWTPCPVSCGQGTISRSRVCRSRLPGPVPPGACNGIDDIRAIQTQTCRPGPCYEFTQWTEWILCSETCGDGFSTRTRRCVEEGTLVDAPSSSFCADPLNIGMFQRRECKLQPCYRFTPWSDWTRCSVTCGSGRSTRKRRCVSDDGSNAMMSPCFDSENLGAFQSRVCDFGPC